MDRTSWRRNSSLSTRAEGRLRAWSTKRRTVSPYPCRRTSRVKRISCSNDSYRLFVARKAKYDEITVATSNVAIVVASSSATARFRRAQRNVRPAAPIRRAATGSPARKRRRSAARSPAVA